MRRIALLLGTFMLVFGFSVLGATSAQAYSCNNTYGATADDSECGMHPLDMQSVLLDQERKITALEATSQRLWLGLITITATGATIGVILYCSRKTEDGYVTKPAELQNN